MITRGPSDVDGAGAGSGGACVGAGGGGTASEVEEASAGGEGAPVGASGGLEDGTGCADEETAGGVGVGSTYADDTGPVGFRLDTIDVAGISGDSVGSASGAGVTVVYWVTITTGGGSSGVVGRAAAAELAEVISDSCGLADKVEAGATPELIC